MSEATSGALFEAEFTTHPPRWYGRIVSSDTWQDNVKPDLFGSLSDIKGWGYRYKVRVFGWHTGDKKVVTDDQIVMANVVLPVTAGSGHGGAKQTPSLTAGTVVTGFFMDGMGGQEPYIDGVLGNSSNESPKKQPEGKIGGYQQFNDTYKEGSPQTSAKVPDDLIHANAPLQTFDSLHLSTIKAYTDQDEDRRVKEHIRNPCKKKNSDLKGIQLAIQKLLEKVEKIKKAAGAISSAIEDIQTLIQQALHEACEIISSLLKNILQYVLAFMLDKLAEIMRKVIPKLFPTLVPKLTKVVKEGCNLLVCLINKIIDALLEMVCGLLEKLLDKKITAPKCAADEFVSDFLGSIMGDITSTLDSVLSSISSVASGLGSAVDIINQVLEFILGIFKFFKCDYEMSCPVYDELSLATPPNMTLDLPSFGGGGGSGGGGGGAGGGGASNCDTGPKPCGTPVAQFSSGSGSGASANVIVSPKSSSVIGFDITNPGSGYETAPFVDIADGCGKGKGASAKVNMNGNQIKNITVTSPGDGYLSRPDGSLGGNGSVWKAKDEGYVKTKNGNYYVVAKGVEPVLDDGDEYYPAPQEVASVTPEETYPVLLTIEEIEIFDPGFGYCDNDQLVVSPDNGAILEPLIKDGKIIKVKVINGGLGFDDIPEITTTADSCGYNFEAVPILKPVPPEEVEQIPSYATLINVVDCVGKIPPKQEFDINPR